MLLIEHKLSLTKYFAHTVDPVKLWPRDVTVTKSASVTQVYDNNIKFIIQCKTINKKISYWF